MQKATDLNPLSSDDWAYLSRAHGADGQNLQARSAAERALKLRPDSTRAQIALGTSRLLEKRGLEARELFSKVDDPGWRLTGLAMAEHTLGDATRSKQNLDAAIIQSAKDSAFQIAEAYAWRGDKSKAIEWLQRAYRQRDGGMITLRYDPLLAAIREESQYKELLKQLRLPP